MMGATAAGQPWGSPRSMRGMSGGLPPLTSVEISTMAVE